ncbi:MAG TPA: isoprenyl transferase [Vicinamibacteria bacterium]|nr:isoprenyl transferase [Vicinamibacteria bacterium]
MSRQDILEVTAEGSIERELFERIDLDRLPRHIAVIMDGNGRWAHRRELPRVEGHLAGIASVREAVETCARLDLSVLTLYAFSVENWKRPKSEVEVLMKLLKQYLHLELPTLMANDVRFRVLGRLQNLPSDVVEELHNGMEMTRNNRGLLFNVALNYGGRAEIVDACQAIVDEAVERGEAPRVDETLLAAKLYTAGIADPDLLIRTSGEMRVSNFLLWQIAYAEIWVTETLWPDFRKRDLFEAIIAFQKRERRYGGIAARSTA